MSDDKQYFSLNLYGAGAREFDRAEAARERKLKRVLGSLLLADQPSCEIFEAISRDFVMLAGAPLRALHLESKTEMCKASFVNWCRRYGELNLAYRDGTSACHEAAGLYWWECQHYPEHRRVITRASLTAKADLYRPKLEGQTND